MRHLIFIAAAALITTPVWAALDGKVAGLNLATYQAFKKVKQRNPGALNVRDANDIRLAILADQQIDPAERDLLEEMTQSQFRLITVTPPNAAATEKVLTYPVSGATKQALRDVLNPPANLAAEWDNAGQGWNAIIAEYKKPDREASVLNFTVGKIDERWKLSNIQNGYKPLRDEIGKRYGYSNSAGSDANTGRTLVYKACNQVDRNAGDAMPDFLYNWVRPGGFL